MESFWRWTGSFTSIAMPSWWTSQKMPGSERWTQTCFMACRGLKQHATEPHRPCTAEPGRARFGFSGRLVLQRSGFAGTSRLSNMGTGLWQRHAWTKSLLETWWQERSLFTRLWCL